MSTFNFSTIFGDSLLKAKETVQTSDVLGDCEAVMIYFSAHWCPPCKGFTPVLAEKYKALKEAGKKTEIVFVSGDESQEQFDSYYAEMPWLALPFSQKEINATLNGEYECEGIPYLVVLDGKTGELLTNKGRNKVSGAKFVEEFPYRPKPFTSFSDLFGETLQKGKEEVKTSEVLKDLDAVMIYFSAHWCPPCKGFTPVFAEKYKALKESGKKFDCIFASSDREEKAFDDYYAEMPWLALPYKERDLKAELADTYGCSGIPYLVVLDGKTGKIITTNGRGGVTADSFLEDFPYHPKPMYDISESMDGINKGLCVLLVQDKAPEEVKNANGKILTEVAKSFQAKGKENPIKAFFTLNKGQMVGFIRGQCHFKDEDVKPTMVLLNVSKESYWKEEGKEFTQENLEKMIQEQQADKLEKKSLAGQ